MRSLLRAGAVPPLVFLLLAAAFVSAGPARAQETETPAATRTPRPTPSPTPSPPDLRLAARFAQDGILDEAAGAYLAVIAQSSQAERLAARIGLAQVYRQQGSYLLAARQLDAYLLEAPVGGDVRNAQFMLATTLLLAGDDAGALPLYDAYIQAGGPATVYARIGRAEALAALGQAAQASAEGNPLLTEDLPPGVRANFVLQMAQAFERASPQDALGWYGRLGSESASPSDQALALWRAGLIQHDLGNDNAWIANGLAVIEQYPETSTALEALENLPPAKIMISSYQIALVYYYNGESERARASFLQVAGFSAEAAFYLGVLDERDGATGRAIAQYARVPELDSQSSLADDALWWQGRLLEQEGRPGDAIALYNRLAAEYSASSFAADARFRVGLLNYDRGLTGDAVQIFAAIASAANGLDRQRALLWQGKALAAAGDNERADAVWQTLRKEAPNDYYGLRAAVLLGDAGDRLRSGDVDAGETPDWNAIEAWLRDAKGSEALLARPLLFSSPHWSQGNALLAAGLTQQANAEFALLLDRASGDAAMLMALARYMRAAGMIDLSSQAAARLLNQVPASVAAGAPADLWELAYPAPFADALAGASEDEDVPEVLLLAMVRQESFFNPLAGSPAGAVGLTQVVPATGEAIAADLDIAQFHTSDLYRPSLSLRFGAHYLREQLDTFDGDIYAALAAYNAGPGNALRWRDVSGDDVDRFVAEIEFDQTETYVLLVAENLARYRQIYHGEREPALPGD